MADGVTDFAIILISLVVGAAVFVLIYISKLVRSAVKVSKQGDEDQSKISEPITSKKAQHSNKHSGKKKVSDKRGRESKQTFSHQWLLTSLKGHSSNVLDMDFSANGKFLATCGEEDSEEPDPGGGGGSNGSGHSSGSEGNKENAVLSKAFLSRRQKKNRVRRDDDSPVIKRMTKKSGRRTDALSSKHFKLNLSDSDLSVLLRHYLLTPEQIMSLGYPIESALFPSRAIIYKSSCPTDPSDYFKHVPQSSHLFDVNAREFIPGVRIPFPVIPKGMNYAEIGDAWNVGHSLESGDSNDNLESSESTGSKCSDKSENGDKSDGERSVDSDICDDEKSEKENLVPKGNSINGVQRTLQQLRQESEEKKCVRCNRGFFLMCDGEYLTQEKCLYHWGKLQRVFGPSNGDQAVRSEYSCCRGKKNSRGCTTAKLHVWNGVGVGVNGPFEGYVRTKPRKTPPSDGNYGIYAIDCEMCYTTLGLELTKVTVVSSDGRSVYDTLVKPDNLIIDYNTRFSGITAKDLKKGNTAKSLKDVQNDLMGFINADTILIGHGLENDLRALKVMHSTVIDTSVIFPHYFGLPYRRSLRSLVNSFLKRDIQKQSSGHDSFEDARACIELMLWRVRKDFKHVFEPKIIHF